MENERKQEEIDDLKRRVILLENLIISMLNNNTPFASDIIKEARKKLIKNERYGFNTKKEKLTSNRRKVLI